MPRKYTDGKLDMEILRATAEKCSNWGRWGPDDEIGTLNHVTPEDIVAAAQLIRKGKVFSLALNFDNEGPQRGLWGNRFNPIHTMLATGTDAVAGNQDEGGIRYADDMVSLAAAVRHAVGRAGAHLLRRQDVERLRRAPWSTPTARRRTASRR